MNCDCGFTAETCAETSCLRKNIHRAGLTAGSKWPNTGVPATDATRQTPMATVSHPWRCFHCDDVFTSRSEASAHFGYEIDATPACKIAPDLRGLIKFMRWQEGELQRYRREDSDASRQFYALGADHARALQTEEEKGYARGLADGRAETREDCAKVADAMANDQQATNEKHPEHAAAYETWRAAVLHYRNVAAGIRNTGAAAEQLSSTHRPEVP